MSPSLLRRLFDNNASGPRAAFAGLQQQVEMLPARIAESASAALAEVLPPSEETTILTTLGWVSAGLGAVALGLFVGRELRQRYKFNRRTPYDFYAHSGDEHEMEFGVGV